jgi:hypothetical protein
LQSTLSTKGLSDDPVALASLRVTFGGRPSPLLFSEVSESVTNLANALARCKSGDPGDLLPNHSNLIGEMKLEPNTIPLAQARELIVHPKIDAFGLIDVFIDDIISVFPALLLYHARKCSLAALLAMDVASQPVHPHETVPRKPMLATDKALAEGTPAESQIILNHPGLEVRYSPTPHLPPGRQACGMETGHPSGTHLGSLQKAGEAQGYRKVARASPAHGIDAA